MDKPPMTRFEQHLLGEARSPLTRLLVYIQLDVLEQVRARQIGRAETMPLVPRDSLIYDFRHRVPPKLTVAHNSSRG